MPFSSELEDDMKTKALCVLLFAATLGGLAFAAGPNPPTVISPTSTPYTFANGIAPNGIAATQIGIFFTQPFVDGLQPRGIYSITTAGVVTAAGSIPTAAGISAENGLAIAPGIGSGFTAGDRFATGVSTTNSANDAVYKNGSGIPFIDGISATLSKHQTGLGFDEVGSFNGALIITADTTIGLYNAAGALLAHYTGPTGFVLQASTVAPLSYAACPGCIFVTAMPSGNINNPAPSGNGQILTVAPNAANGSAAVLFATTTGIPEPESIQFVTSNSLLCTIGKFNYFASGYATDSQLNSVSTTGAILAWTPAQLTPFVGHFLVQNEEFTGPLHGAIYEDGDVTKVFSDTTTATNSVGYQLEDTAIVQCPVAPSGCPATQGFWHKGANWPNVTKFVDGVIYNGRTDHSMVIGGIKYTQSQLLLIMPSGSLHAGGYVNALSQFVAAVLNIAAGAQTDNIDSTISAINTDLAGIPFIIGNQLAPISASLQATLSGFETALGNYNSAVGLSCSEGSGLSVGN
jgi:hypothetical protein